MFSVDSFGAILPEATQDAGEVPPEVLGGGMVGWATSDPPWAHVLDRAKFAEVLDRVRALAPTRSSRRTCRRQVARRSRTS